MHDLFPLAFLILGVPALVMLIVGICLVFSFVMAVIAHDDEKWSDAWSRDPLRRYGLQPYVIALFFQNLPHSKEYRKTLFHGIVLIGIGGSLVRLLWMMSK